MTNGMMGKCPEDYTFIQAAKYLGVAPWQLMEQPIYWEDRALKFMQVEYEARKIIEDRNK